jgi:dephospho-CoA kinase
VFVLGLTGGIAMGKSTAAAAFRSFGVPLFDADAAVHRLMAPGGAAVRPIGETFPGSLDPAGGVARRALGRLVFGDPAALARLEAIVHPLVHHDERRFLARAAAAGHSLVVLDIPLLYETGAEARLDAVVVVSAPTFLQSQRVLRRTGMDADRLRAIRARQMADAEKRRRADFVVSTGLEKRRAVVAIGRVLDSVRHRRGRAWPRRWAAIPCG